MFSFSADLKYILIGYSIVYTQLIFFLFLLQIKLKNCQQLAY